MKKIYVFMAVVVLLSACVSKGEYDAQVKKCDSLAAVCKQLTADNAAMQKELEGYRNDPARVLAEMRADYEKKNYEALKPKYDRLMAFHPEAQECATAKSICEQAIKEQEAARKKAEAEAAKREAERRAKMSKIERIMEKYGCDEDVATCISRGQVRIGMTDDQCRAAWGRPRDINRSTGTWGVHEQWCYGSGNYLYMENGILRSIQN